MFPVSFISDSVSYDAEAQAFFDRVAAAGGTLSATEKTATNQLVLDMKAAGIWTSMNAVYPMVGASAAACAQNLVSSSFTGSFTSGWTFASTGVTPNGVSAYMDTNLNQSGNLTPSNNHISIYSRTDINGTVSPLNLQCDCGITDFIAFSFSQIQSRLNGNFNYENGSQTPSGANANSLGMFLGSSISSTSGKSYKNGNLFVSSTTSQSRTMFNNNIFIAATNNRTIGAAVQFSIRQYAFASIGDGLNDTQASNFYTSVQTFQTTLSRQV